ncbi:hypothetical protein RFI_23359, partial [Reticulomyxa filosa]
FFFFFLHVCGVKINITFPSSIVPGVTKLRDGDKLSFRLRFEKKYILVDVKLIEKAPMYAHTHICVYNILCTYIILIPYKLFCLNSRKIKDIPVSPELEEKVSSYCDISRWFEDPSQGIYTHICIYLFIFLHTCQLNDNNVAKESHPIGVGKVIMQCICEPCQVPDLLLCALSPSRQNQDVNEDEHDEEVNPANSSEKNEEIVKLLKLVEEFHEMTEEDNLLPLLQKCIDIILEEKIVECDIQSNFVIPNGCANDNTSKIVRIYLYCREISSTSTNKPLILLQKGQGYPMREVSAETAYLYVADFRVKKNTSLSVDVKYRHLCTSVIVGQRCAYFVELKNQVYFQSVHNAFSYMKSKVVDNPSQFSNVFVTRHLMENIRDEESFQFSRQAMRDMVKEVQKPTKELQSLFQKITDQLNKNEVDIKLIYQIIFVCEQLGEQRQYLYPPQLFAAVKCAITTPNIIETMKSMFWIDLKCNIYGDKIAKAEGFQQFMLIPCFNLLGSRQMQMNDDFLRRFDSRNFRKVPQLAIRCIDVVETDLKIRRLLTFSPKLCTELYLMQILHWQDDDDLSQEVLKHLLSNNEFMTVQTWAKLWTSYNSKCADVISKLHKCNFEKWSQFVERLQTIQALKEDQTRKKLLAIFDERDFQKSVVLSDKTFIAFISFILKHKDIIWQNWENVLQTLDYYIDKTEMIYHADTLMAIFGVLWKYCLFDQKLLKGMSVMLLRNY